MGKKPDFRKSPTPRFGFDEIDEVTADSPPLHSRIDRDIVEEKVIRGFNQDNDAAYGFRIRGDKRFIIRNSLRVIVEHRARRPVHMRHVFLVSGRHDSDDRSNIGQEGLADPHSTEISLPVTVNLRNTRTSFPASSSPQYSIVMVSLSKRVATR